MTLSEDLSRRHISIWQYMKYPLRDLEDFSVRLQQIIAEYRNREYTVFDLIFLMKNADKKSLMLHATL